MGHLAPYFSGFLNWNAQVLAMVEWREGRTPVEEWMPDA